MSRSLTARDDRFCKEYRIDRNGAKAYQRAGFKCKNLRVASVCASRILARADIRARINKLDSRDAEKADIKSVEILREYKRLAFSDIRNYVRIEGGKVSIVDSDKWTPDQAAAVESVSETKEGIKLKLYSKPDALKALGEHKHLFNLEDDESYPGDHRSIDLNITVTGARREYKFRVNQ